MTEPRVALFPGSFDPITSGHEDIVRRALALADRVVVAVAHAPTQSKQARFSVDERVEMIRETFADEPRVEAAEFQGLLVDYARRVGARVVVRGVRTVTDWEYELQMSMMNRSLAPGVETVFLAPAPEHSFVSGTLVRQVAALGGDVSRFVPASVLSRFQGETATQPGGGHIDHFMPRPSAFGDKWLSILDDYFRVNFHAEDVAIIPVEEDPGPSVDSTQKNYRIFVASSRTDQAQVREIQEQFARQVFSLDVVVVQQIPNEVKKLRSRSEGREQLQ